MPIVDNPKLYESVKAMADKKYSKPSAYKSGFIVKTYKQLGGTYTDDGKPKNLKRWYKERWTDVGNKDYPVLRPTVKVSKKTPLLPSEISNLSEQIKLKQKIKGKKNLPPFISHGIGMKGGAPNINVRRLNHVMPGLRLTDMEKQILVDEINRIRIERGIATSRASKILPTIFMAVTGGAVPQNIHDEVIRMFQEMFDDGMTDQEGEGAGRKGGMKRGDKELIIPPPARVNTTRRSNKEIIYTPPVPAARVIGEATRPFDGYEVHADFREAPAVFSNPTLAEEQRQIAQAEQRDQANIDSLFRQFGQLYPLERSDSAAVYNDFTERYLPRRSMNESYVANLPRAERGRILNAFLTQRQGMCVASGKPKRLSKWVEHVKAHAKKHGVSYKQAMQDSRRTYVG